MSTIVFFICDNCGHQKQNGQSRFVVRTSAFIDYQPHRELTSELCQDCAETFDRIMQGIGKKGIGVEPGAVIGPVRQITISRNALVEAVALGLLAYKERSYDAPITKEIEAFHNAIKNAWSQEIFFQFLGAAHEH